MAKNEIVIKGACEHNLKNVDLTIPRDKLVVFTGLSGSGKARLRLILFMLTDSADIWSHYLPMRECFWEEWKSPM